MKQIFTYRPRFTCTNIGGYRYFFNGQEGDNEVFGENGIFAFEYRMHDARLGRFWSVGPLAAKYPWNSTYAFAENRVIEGKELEGKEVLSQQCLQFENAEGWGWIAGCTAGELVTISANIAYSDGFYGLNISLGIGGGVFPVSESVYATYTKVAPISDEAVKDYKKILRESRKKIVKQINDIDNQVNTLTKTNKELGIRLINSKLPSDEKNKLGRSIEKNSNDIDKLNKNKRKLNNIIESIDQGIKTLDSK